MKRILGVIFLLIVLITAISLIYYGDLRLSLFIPLSATVGVYMGLVFPFSLLLKLSIVAGLVLSLIAMFYGFKSRKYIQGQSFAILGVVGWISVGLIGLSTGT